MKKVRNLMKSKLKYNHSDKFYEKKYNELKAWAIKKNIELPWKTQEGFEVTYDDYRRLGSKNPIKTMEYNLQYNTDYQTAMAEKQFLNAANLKNVSLKKLKKMSTQEFYEEYSAEIDSFRQELKTSGLNSYQANKIISMHFFGSR